MISSLSSLKEALDGPDAEKYFKEIAERIEKQYDLINISIPIGPRVNGDTVWVLGSGECAYSRYENGHEETEDLTVYRSEQEKRALHSSEPELDELLVNIDARKHFERIAKYLQHNGKMRTEPCMRDYVAQAGKRLEDAKKRKESVLENSLSTLKHLAAITLVGGCLGTCAAEECIRTGQHAPSGSEFLAQIGIFWGLYAGLRVYAYITDKLERKQKRKKILESMG